GRGEEVWSFSSAPAIAWSRWATPLTSWANGPTWSSELAKATTPNRETRPYVGFIPTQPTSDAGWRMEPPVSVPRAPGTMRAATAAALPPDEPPGVRDRSHGLRVGPQALFSVEEPIANSSMFSLPTITAPACFSLRTTVASYGGT